MQYCNICKPIRDMSSDVNKAIRYITEEATTLDSWRRVLLMLETRESSFRKLVGTDMLQTERSKLESNAECRGYVVNGRTLL